MNVNSVFTVIGRNRIAILSGMLIAAGAIFFLTSAFTGRSRAELLNKRLNLTIREIGHHLLLHAGDSMSRVLPVKEKSEGIFLLQFENDFVFKPDTLVALTQRFLAKTNLRDYTVTVHECFKPDIVYGFQISPPGNSIKACNGRSQPKGCYTIEIAFADFDDSAIDYSNTSLIFIGVLFLAAVALMAKDIRLHSSISPHNATPQHAANPVNTLLPSIGRFVFDVHHRKLLLDGGPVELTEKECKVLQLLNRNFGQLTPREDLIQEVWVNEGVITGRSLDMFVSKLRKKLSADPEVRITNIHGRGYKLELSPSTE
jgi:DNA-binding winged helix-turn-helix (wHTH) protein